MERKPDIQYIGQFYIHGSEAQELARKEQEKLMGKQEETKMNKRMFRAG